MRWVAVLVVLVVAVGCANAGPASVARSPAATTVAERAPKTITLGQLNPVKAYAPWDFGDTTGGGPLLVEIHASSLVSQDARGNKEPRLAARLPSFDDGSISLLADGRMRVAWTLRPGVTWHDSTPFTADDLRFSWDVLSHPEIPSGGSQTTVVRLVESVDAPDPLTFVMVWKRPFYQALDMGVRNWWPFPRHLLGDAFGGEKQAFMAQPYFTTEYAHLGPFRLVEFQAGELQVFRRSDSYMLGAARLDSILIRTIRDPNALFANLKADAIDIVGERALPSELFIQLRDEWLASAPREGVVVQRQYNWRNLQIQHGQQWARPSELAQDVRARRGLLRVMDRPAMEQFLYPGFSDISGDTYLLKDDPRLAVAGYPFARYTYDPQIGLRELEEVGWKRATDGRMLGRDGRPLQIEVRGTSTDVKNVALIADFWRRVGIDASELIVSGPTSQDPEFRSTFPGAESTARSTGDQIFPNFDGRLQSLPENRWTGGNRMHYANPALDRRFDQVYVTLESREQGLILKEIGDIFADDLPVLPLFFEMAFAAVRSGIDAVVGDFVSTVGPGVGPGLMARNAHLWDRR